MRALVCSGGGSRGSFQAGVIKELLIDNSELDYDIYAGVSVGALNAAMLATAPLKESFPELEKIWLNKVHGNNSVWKHHLWNYILYGIIFIVSFVALAFVSLILSAPKLFTILLFIIAFGGLYIPYYTLNNSHSIYTTEPLRDLIEDVLDVDKLKNSGKLLRVGAVNFNTGEYDCGAENNDNIISWIMASSSFPIFFPMQKIGDHYWTDGGVTEIAPLTDVIKLGATEVDIILATPLQPSFYDGLPGLPAQFLRDIDVMGSGTLRNDLEARCRGNNIKIRIFVPEHSLTEHSLSFDPGRIRTMFEEGRKVAKKTLEA